MTAGCTGVPVSWLRLERFRLGELAEDERRSVAAHVLTCAACAACVARIDADGALDLPPLELGRPPGLSLPARPAPRARHVRLFAAAGGLAVAAIALLAIGRSWRSADAPGGELARVKGGGVDFVLVRDDGVRVSEGTAAFRDGDRFKAVVTCPPSMSASFDLVVFDAGGASFPIEPARHLTCGNEVPLPGAFRLTGTTSEEVCLVWSEDARADAGVDRAALSLDAVSGSRRAMCKDLEPGGDGR